MPIYYKQFFSEEEEVWSIAKLIQTWQKENYPLSEIAILAREHQDLVYVAQVLQQFAIPIKYERRENVLAKEHINWIIKILTFVNSLCQQREEEAEYLLPEILSYPFWELDKLTIYQISLYVWQKNHSSEKTFAMDSEQTLQADSENSANKTRVTWLSTMLSWPESKVRNIASSLLNLSFLAKYSTAEKVIDEILELTN